MIRGVVRGSGAGERSAVPRSALTERCPCRRGRRRAGASRVTVSYGTNRVKALRAPGRVIPGARAVVSPLYGRRRVLRSRQDDHRQELGARVRQALLPGGPAVAAGDRQEHVRADRLHARGRRRVEDGRGPRGDAVAHQGLAAGPRRADRRRDPRRGDLADRVRGGARALRRAPRAPGATWSSCRRRRPRWSHRSARTSVPTR